jgi:hypothetical protein
MFNFSAIELSSRNTDKIVHSFELVRSPSAEEGFKSAHVLTEHMREEGKEGDKME